MVANLCLLPGAKLRPAFRPLPVGPVEVPHLDLGLAEVLAGASFIAVSEVRPFAAAVVALCAATSLLAQNATPTGRGTASTCYRAEAGPACSVFFLTNGGVYDDPSLPYGGLAGFVDWGVMVNVDNRQAIGASFFARGDTYGVAYGPAARYRRWLGPRASLDVALGVDIGVSDPNHNRTGSFYALLKWNPTYWLGVGVRPELIRTLCSTSSCTEARVSFGGELGWVPGLVGSALGVVFGGLASVGGATSAGAADTRQRGPGHVA